MKLRQSKPSVVEKAQVESYGDTIEVFMPIGRYLREKRIATLISQSEASDKLGYSGPQYLSNIENNKRNASPCLLMKMCELYGISKTEMRQVYIDSCARIAKKEAEKKWVKE
ncbi:helix-turn-helix domain-containing protein [Bdellovibrio sp. SKB1291214]|uniref:helix-turn-helix domain-containing protein n=1 Tax=Bdellovibrio sp. SKB1291214 TaxID=1732569 RepID=UPI000B51788B|nr:helix-turn-helix transcriptional regulator [Bdellovibrio sp. SKB1291214]UYL07884.1 helix-turn-helix domain-containing protein [Bdellovibrio sp. SKB1291214]